MSDKLDKDSKDSKDSLAALGSRLRAARDHVQDPLNKPEEEKSGKGGLPGLAFRVAIEIISAVAVGLAIGWFLDKWLDTRPWFMLVFIVLGSAAGIVNVYRMAAGYDYAAGYEKQKHREQNGDDGTGVDGGT
jgi:ATP synthase protein I